MLNIYIRQAFEILRKEGPSELHNNLAQTSLWGCLLYQYPRFRIATIKNMFHNNIQYKTPPNPYDTIRVHPSKIKYYNGIKKNKNGNWLYPPTVYGGLGQIRGGKWDKPGYRKNVSELPAVVGFREKFQENKDWEDTEYYASLKRIRERDKKYEEFGYDTIEEYLTDTFHEYNKLYYNIQEEGYKEGHKSSREEPGNRRFPNVHDILEIIVNVDRDGKISLVDGHNRFAIAKVLNINIPVHVVCRHKKWQKTRDKIYVDHTSNNMSLSNYPDIAELSDHPDLQDILT